jgi:glycosyltransferase involved in cell wall biosynthesis
VIVPCGFDPEELWPLDKTSARTTIGLPADEGMILHVGRMVPRKGIDTVIRAYARFLGDYDRPTKLVIVGGESDEPIPSAHQKSAACSGSRQISACRITSGSRDGAVEAI